jgi:hypothetical protein
MLDSFKEAVWQGKFHSLEASDYYDFANLHDPEAILFNLQQVAVSL